MFIIILLALWFQSTPSVKRATMQLAKAVRLPSDFNPHPLWRGRPFNCSMTRFTSSFQSTPSVKRATLIAVIRLRLEIFQSTPSVKRATFFHPLCRSMQNHFNPHPLWRGRRWRHQQAGYHNIKFQSTPSVKRATLYAYCDDIVKLFQSTPSVKRATNSLMIYHNNCLNFNPHPLWRGRPTATVTQHNKF